MSRDRSAAARRTSASCEHGGDPQALIDAARRLVFLKGNDAHDYKFSSAVLEDAAALPATARDRLLAAGAFWFKGTADPDTALAVRARAAIAG